MLLKIDTSLYVLQPVGCNINLWVGLNLPFSIYVLKRIQTCYYHNLYIFLSQIKMVCNCPQGFLLLLRHCLLLFCGQVLFHKVAPQKFQLVEIMVESTRYLFVVI